MNKSKELESMIVRREDLQESIQKNTLELDNLCEDISLLETADYVSRNIKAKLKELDFTFNDDDKQNQVYEKHIEVITNELIYFYKRMSTTL
jgi:hypothetical protein